VKAFPLFFGGSALDRRTLTRLAAVAPGAIQFTNEAFKFLNCDGRNVSLTGARGARPC
jgi:hypothetical protein